MFILRAASSPTETSTNFDQKKLVVVVFFSFLKNSPMKNVFPGSLSSRVDKVLATHYFIEFSSSKL